MATTTDGLDAALNKIVSMLGVDSSTKPDSTTAVNPPIGDTISSLTSAQQQEIARLIYHSQSVPTITPSMLFDMEQNLPGLIAFLHSLNSRPAAREELERFISGSRSVDRSGNDQQRLNELAQVMAADAFGNGDAKVLPLVPVVACGIAVFMGAYTIVHNWNR
jgi:hypothetical protein